MAKNKKPELTVRSQTEQNQDYDGQESERKKFARQRAAEASGLDEDLADYGVRDGEFPRFADDVTRCGRPLRLDEIFR